VSSFPSTLKDLLDLADLVGMVWSLVMWLGKGLFPCLSQSFIDLSYEIIPQLESDEDRHPNLTYAIDYPLWLLRPFT